MNPPTIKKIDLPNIKRQVLIFDLMLDADQNVVMKGEWTYDEYDSIAELDLKGKNTPWYLIKTKNGFFVHSGLAYPLEGAYLI